MPGIDHPTMIVGLISDTHGLVRPQALELLQGSDHIIHAGDICEPAVLEALTRIAPVTAVRGNNDRGPWSVTLRETEIVEAEDALIYVIHDLAELDIDPGKAGMHAVISGHSHKGYLCKVDGRVVTQGDAYGHLLSRIKMKVDPASGKVLYTVEHEVRSLTNPLYARPLINRNPDQSNNAYVRGQDAFRGTY